MRDKIGHQQKVGSWAWKAKNEAVKLAETIGSSEGQKGLVNRLGVLGPVDFLKFTMPSFKTHHFRKFQRAPNTQNLRRSLENAKKTLGGIEFRWYERIRYPSLLETLEDCREDIGKAGELIQMADVDRWKKTFGGKWKELRDFYEKLENGQSVRDYVKDHDSLEALESLSDEGFVDIIVSKE